MQPNPIKKAFVPTVTNCPNCGSDRINLSVDLLFTRFMYFCTICVSVHILEVKAVEENSNIVRVEYNTPNLNKKSSLVTPINSQQSFGSTNPFLPPRSPSPETAEIISDLNSINRDNCSLDDLVQIPTSELLEFSEQDVAALMGLTEYMLSQPEGLRPEDTFQEMFRARA